MATNKPTSARSTIRQGKKTALSSTQRFLSIAEIHNDTVFLKNGGVRAVLQVEAVNFNLKSEVEQQGIIAGYQSFVNTITFPIQILIRSAKMNIDPYLMELRRLAGVQNNNLLKQQTLSYADYVEKLIDVADIMQKKFFVIVPLDRAARSKSLLQTFFSWINPDDSASKFSQRQHEFVEGGRLLSDRVNLVQVGLENAGLLSRRLVTHELVELYYQIYNPKTSQEQKLPPESQLRVESMTL